MKLIEYVTVYAALLALSKTELPAQSAYNVVKIKKNILPQVEHFQKTELELVEKYAAKLDNGKPDVRQGRVMFETDTDKQCYDKARHELCAIEDHYIYDKIDIVIPRHCTVSPGTLEALESVARVVIDGDDV